MRNAIVLRTYCTSMGYTAAIAFDDRKTYHVLDGGSRL